jgi:hypothetical protein
MLISLLWLAIAFLCRNQFKHLLWFYLIFHWDIRVTSDLPSIERHHLLYMPWTLNPLNIFMSGLCKQIGCSCTNLSSTSVPCDLCTRIGTTTVSHVTFHTLILPCYMFQLMYSTIIRKTFTKERLPCKKQGIVHGKGFVVPFPLWWLRTSVETCSPIRSVSEKCCDYALFPILVYLIRGGMTHIKILLSKFIFLLSYLTQGHRIK